MASVNVPCILVAWVAGVRAQPQLLPYGGGTGCCQKQGRGGPIDYGWKIFDGPLDNGACSQKCLDDPDCGFMVTFDVPTPYCSILKVNAPCDLPLDHEFGECGNSGTAAETARTYWVSNRKDVVVEEPAALAAGYHCGDTQNSAIPLVDCNGKDAQGRQHDSCGPSQECNANDCTVDGSRPDWISCTSAGGQPGCYYPPQPWNSCIQDECDNCWYANPPSQKAAFLA